MSRHEVHVVETRHEFDAVMDCQWAGFSGQEYFWDAWFPVDKGAHLGRSKPDTQGAIRESKDRMWNEHKKDPSSTWIYVLDPSRSNDQALLVTGSCQWRVHEHPNNPFPSGVPEISCPAWSGDDEANKFMAEWVSKLFTRRVNWMSRPHVGLSWMAVRPEFRQTGIGRVLMRYGTTIADRLALESFIEASELGKSLYFAHGFRVIEEVNFDLSKPDSSDEWKAMSKRYLPRGFYVASMWRPAGGQWDERCDELWKERLEISGLKS